MSKSMKNIMLRVIRAKLNEGMDIDEAIKRLKGIKCGPRPTSCPDQLATALEQYKAQQ